MWKALFYWMLFDGSLVAGFKSTGMALLNLFTPAPTWVLQSRFEASVESLGALALVLAILLPACAALHLADKLRTRVVRI